MYSRLVVEGRGAYHFVVFFALELKMAVHRFQMASNKKSALLKQSMREVAILLAEVPPKEEKARIKAEALIRDDYMIEAFDILSLTCELLSSGKTNSSSSSTTSPRPRRPIAPR